MMTRSFLVVTLLFIKGLFLKGPFLKGQSLKGLLPRGCPTKALLIFGLTFLALVPNVQAQSYRYMDEAGNIFFVDRLFDVPMRYRNQIPGAVPTVSTVKTKVKKKKEKKPKVKKPKKKAKVKAPKPPKASKKSKGHYDNEESEVSIPRGDVVVPEHAAPRVPAESLPSEPANPSSDSVVEAIP